jgi:plasmid maintenance system killer protein
MDVHVNEQERLILHLDTTKVKEVTIADLHFTVTVMS